MSPLQRGHSTRQNGTSSRVPSPDPPVTPMNSTGDGKPSRLSGPSTEGPGTAWSPQGGSQLTNALIFTLSYQSSAQSAVTWGRHEAKVEGSWVPPRGDGNRPRPALRIKPAPPRKTWQVPVSRWGRGPGRDWTPGGARRGGVGVECAGRAPGSTAPHPGPRAVCTWQPGRVGTTEKLLGPGGESTRPSLTPRAPSWGARKAASCSGRARHPAPPNVLTGGGETGFARGAWPSHGSLGNT